MKKTNLKNAHKLSRNSQKQITGGDPPQLQCAAGCYDDYFGDGLGRCVVPPCSPPNYGTIVQNANGRYQCCY